MLTLRFSGSRFGTDFTDEFTYHIQVIGAGKVTGKDNQFDLLITGVRVRFFDDPYFGMKIDETTPFCLQRYLYNALLQE